MAFPSPTHDDGYRPAVEQSNSRPDAVGSYPLAISERGGGFGIDGERWQRCGRGLGKRDEVPGCALSFEFVKGHGGRERDVANPGATQCREVAPYPERGTQVAGERTNVRSRTYVDGTVDVDKSATASGSHDLKTGNRDRTRGELDVLPRAHARVRALAVHLDGADRAWSLQDRAGQCRDDSCDRLISDV